MGFYEDFLTGLESAARERFKNPAKLAESLGVEPNLITRWLNKDRVPRAEKMGEVLDALGAKLIFPDKDAPTSREVYFVNVKSPLTEDGDPPVDPENYTAVPLLSDVGAGPGIIRNEYEEPEEWFLVNRGAQSMLGRPVDKLYAVRIDARSTSMEPALHPGDTVLVDPTDIRVDKPGGIFLVMEPDGSGKIKRVNVEKIQARKLTRLTFYSDNVQEYPPEVHIVIGVIVVCLVYLLAPRDAHLFYPLPALSGFFLPPP